MEVADWLRKSSSAAKLTLPKRATFWKVINCLMLAVLANVISLFNTLKCQIDIDNLYPFISNI
jgi:hypothetical protein